MIKLNRQLKSAESSIKVSNYKTVADHGCRESLIVASEIVHVRLLTDLKQLSSNEMNIMKQIVFDFHIYL